MTVEETFKRGLELQKAGDLTAAEGAYQDVLKALLHAAAFHNLVLIMQRTGRIEEADAVIARGLSLAPGHPRLMNTQAMQLRLKRQLPEALALYEQILAQAPDDPGAKWGYAMTLLACGRLAEAWPFYEARPERLQVEGWAAPSAFRPWRGEDLTGRRLLVWFEQGLGDQILAARFLPLLKGAEVTYMGPPTLRRLFGRLGVDYRPVEQPARVSGYDFWTMPLSLPAVLGVTAGTLPRSPYLAGTPRRVEGRVGVMWRGNPAQDNDHHRSLPPELGARLLSLPGAVSLAPEDTGVKDMQDTADLIAGLDLVISVDTSVAHLAGAMGKPVWVLLPARGWDWCWPRHDADLWHPSARAFTQPAPGQWEPVIDAVERELRPRA